MHKLYHAKVGWGGHHNALIVKTPKGGDGR